MKNPYYLLLLITLASCNNNNDRYASLEKKIDGLQTKLTQTYKPGLGEFMASVQLHHAKRWFAGKNENWTLADFEITEIREALDDIPVYCADRPELKQLAIIQPAIDSISNAVAAKSTPPRFTTGFTQLTASSNSCHQATQHAFNVIKIPTTPPFSNQDFSRPK